MHPATIKPFTQNASRAQGRESVRRNGERHYINHYPHFSVHYLLPGVHTRFVQKLSLTYYTHN
jgi:hypothetical protein